MTGTFELFRMSHNVPPHPPPFQLTGTIRSRAVTLWPSAVALNTRGGLHYSKKCRCMQTNNNTNVHAQMLRVWSGADRNSPETAYVSCFDCPARCASGTIYVGDGGAKTTGLSSKLFEGSPKWLLQILRKRSLTAHASSDCCVFLLFFF